MNLDVLTFNSVVPNNNVVDEALKFNVRNLEHTDSIVLSQYSIALSQYLIYFRAEYNRTRAEIGKSQRFIDATITQIITKDVLNNYKTKTDAKAYIIANTESLRDADETLNVLTYELQLLEGIDKTISELIASFKRELTRRENEMYAIRKDR